ncbi:MAG TPA: hotdog domain-containing protein [Candidatus Thermoplasmatota archaeon]|nr:hotdog domain-containing protein [Candidatus Thermoplasmatota archaeon]
MEGYDLILRRLCLIKDTGHAGTLWGGNMMAWVDEAGAIYAGSKVANETLVTKAFTEINFQHPVRPGDVIEFWGRVSRMGKSSIAIELKVCGGRLNDPERWPVLDVTGVFVAVDSRLRKEPIRPLSGPGTLQS